MPFAKSWIEKGVRVKRLKKGDYEISIWVERRLVHQFLGHVARLCDGSFRAVFVHDRTVHLTRRDAVNYLVRRWESRFEGVKK